MSLPVDIKLTRYDDEYDISWSESGDFAMTNTLETAVLMSVFGERRAKSYEVAEPQNRRGWIGNLVYDTPETEDGCGNWLFQTRRLNTQTLNGVRDETEKGLLWMIADDIAKTITVQTKPDNGRVTLSIVIRVNDLDYLEEVLTL